MNRRHMYFILAVIGTVGPAFVMTPFLMESFMMPHDILAIMFSTPVGQLAGFNLLIGCVTLVVLLHTEGRELGIKTWPPIVAMSLFGVSSGLPLYLYLRENPAK